MIDRVASAAAGLGEALLGAVPGGPPEISQAQVIDETAHRPWALPETPWLMAQTWRDLLFAHWPLPPEDVRPVVPPGLSVDTFEGRAWIGVTPFELTGLRPRGMVPLPGAWRFPELNVRTYASFGGKPGIYFLSLDAANALAVAAARRSYRLPYFRADMRLRRHQDALHYVSERVSGDGEPAAFEATYRPLGPSQLAPRGSLEHFLTERYCLYTIDEQRTVLRGEIQHPPWRLQLARAEIHRNSMTRPWGIELPPTEPHLRFARLQNVLIWPLRPAAK